MLYGSILWGTNECNLRTRREKTFGLYALYDRGRQQFPEGFLGATDRRKLGQLFRQKNAVVLSRSAARRIFGKQNPVGKVFHPNKLTRRSERNYTPEELAAIDYVVSGVMEDLPVNASYSLLNRIDALLINDQQGRFAGYVPGEGTGCTTFALLYPGVKKETVNQRIDPEKNKIFVSGMEGRPQLLSPGKNSTEYYHDLGYGYLCIGLLILLVAVLNFFIFISGNFLNRQKEYNIRRAIGSSCRQVLGLLFAETMIMLMAVGIIVACLLELLYDRLDFSLTRQVIDFPAGYAVPPFVTISGGLCRPVSGSLLGDFPSAESSEHTDRYRNLPENKKKQITELDVGYAIGDLFPVFYRRTGCLFTIGNEYEEYFSFSR